MKDSSKRVKRLGAYPYLSRDVTDLALNFFREEHNLPLTDQGIVALPTPDPMAFSNAESFRNAYWRQKVWSKYPHFDLGIDRKKVALKGFFEAEDRCGITNKRLCDFWNRPVPERYRAVFSRARSLLHHLFDGFTVDEMIDSSRWGPGASTSMSYAQATPQNKWEKATHMTASVEPYLDAFERWCGREFDRTYVLGNKVTTVPKNAKTDRTIAIEPDWNMFFQLGLGGAIRRRLRRRFGLLKDNAQEINQLLARAGSLDGFLGTVDLEAASDSVSLALCEALLPQEIMDHIMNLRSPVGVVGDEVVSYEKVSSMGNGFTFELETAIFYCLVRAASGHAVAYGDDLIIVGTTFDFVREVLNFSGFIINEEKTFTSGPFRESCGGHFFDGVDVTPPYVRDFLKGPSKIPLANRVSELLDNGHWRDTSFKGFYDLLVEGAPRFLKGPKGIDGVIHSNFDEVTPRWSRRYQCFTGDRLVLSRRRQEAPQNGSLLQSLWRPPVHTTWRQSGSFQTGANIVRMGRWHGEFQGISPWAHITT